ncbi:NAD(+)/NADH kinase [Candidatus Contubernalis alkaliaceticus]|uniref:NAD(+)/NADH kinase n=1 Tax=Candidatus Contubernalis alkaliaceticus TaxID=338645 RepID=UPI001F4C29E8|nr:NAD(+)/NADH kinase [Candidatus Contubernalis alkalaceticus]UNC92539.1 NAD(+)/NADH kinase [Candidatus Contubernalis alkalaceticus]
MKAVGIITNLQKEETLATAERILTLCREHDLQVFFTVECASLLGLPELGYPVHRIPEMVDLLLVLGGDGTILAAARKVVGTNIPILGINLGHVGFLAEVEVSDLESSMEKIVSNQFVVQDRMMLYAEVIRNSQVEASFYALNDIVISKGPFSRTIKLKTYINNHLLEAYPGDGVIIASPTGSTGYSLSAGGPIVNPALNLLVVTPICPHMMHHRSVIIAENEKVRIKAYTQQAEVVLTVDGQQGFQLKNDDEIIVKKADYYTKLVKLTDVNFYALLHRKLRER